MSTSRTSQRPGGRPAALRSTATPGGQGATGALPQVEALGLVETDTVARGVVVADGVLKMAPIELLFSGEVSPGKFIVLFGGGVGPVRASHHRGVEIAGERRVDDLLIPQLHPGVIPALEERVESVEHDALGTIETNSVASTIVAADRAAKAAQVVLRRIRLAQGLGGKGFVYLTGDLSSVEAAVAAGRDACQSQLADWSIVPRLHERAQEHLL